MSRGFWTLDRHSVPCPCRQRALGPRAAVARPPEGRRPPCARQRGEAGRGRPQGAWACRTAETAGTVAPRSAFPAARPRPSSVSSSQALRKGVAAPCGPRPAQGHQPRPASPQGHPRRPWPMRAPRASAAGTCVQNVSREAESQLGSPESFQWPTRQRPPRGEEFPVEPQNVRDSLQLCFSGLCPRSWKPVRESPRGGPPHPAPPATRGPPPRAGSP